MKSCRFATALFVLVLASTSLSRTRIVQLHSHSSSLSQGFFRKFWYHVGLISASWRTQVPPLNAELPPLQERKAVRDDGFLFSAGFGFAQPASLPIEKSS